MLNTAVILAGGQSSRMGFDKRFLKVNGLFLMDGIIELLQRDFEEIFVVSSKTEEYKEGGVTFLQDEVAGFGPLGGIHTALRASGSQYAYIIACDMPCINLNYIKYMKEIIVKENCRPEAVVARFGEWIEPFNGFYSKKLKTHIETKIHEGERKISNVLLNRAVFYIKESDARKFSPDWDMFKNLNTLEDLKTFDKTIG